MSTVPGATHDPDTLVSDTHVPPPSAPPGPPPGYYWIWFDDSKASAVAKLDSAIAAYTARFGAPPTVALINQHLLEALLPAPILLEVRPNLDGHTFWLGTRSTTPAAPGGHV